MLTKSCLAILASAALTNGALNPHRHMHNKKALDKKAVVYATEVVVETDYYTVTVDGDAPAATPEAVVTPSTTTAEATPAPPAATTTEVAAPVTPTTLATSITIQQQAAVIEVSTSSTTTQAAVVPTSSAASAAAAASTNKRGAAYNIASLVTPLIASGSKISWAYNWGQVDDGLSAIDSSIEYSPMLWSTRSDFISVWDTNAAAAITAGAKNFLSFNEPDNAGQANLDAATAAAGHIKYMNPYCDKVRCSTPAITNSNLAGEGIEWMEAFVTACAGACKFDFCAAHWYSPANSADFLSFTQKVSTACGGKPVWITEFAPTGDDATIVSFLQEVQDQLDNNATYSFVERYAYFMVSDGNLVSGTAASTIGNTFAFGS